MGASLLVDLGNKNVAAPMAPRPRAILRGVRPDMIDVDVRLKIELCCCQR